MNRCQHHPASTAWPQRRRSPIPMIVTVTSFVAGVVTGTWTLPPPQDRILSVTDKSNPEVDKTQMYNGAHVKACIEANGVLVVRVLNPNGLECTPADAIQPVGPEVSQPR
jgi:hypothetical protein